MPPTLAKLCTLFLATFILCSLVSSGEWCCFTFTRKMLSWSLITSYFRANKDVCPEPAILFVTKKGLRICANPKEDWVQRYVKALDQL